MPPSDKNKQMGGIRSALHVARKPKKPIGSGDNDLDMLRIIQARMKALKASLAQTVPFDGSIFYLQKDENLAEFLHINKDEDGCLETLAYTGTDGRDPPPASNHFNIFMTEILKTMQEHGGAQKSPAEVLEKVRTLPEFKSLELITSYVERIYTDHVKDLRNLRHAIRKCRQTNKTSTKKRSSKYLDDVAEVTSDEGSDGGGVQDQEVEEGEEMEGGAEEMQEEEEGAEGEVEEIEEEEVEKKKKKRKRTEKKVEKTIEKAEKTIEKTSEKKHKKHKSAPIKHTEKPTPGAPAGTPFVSLKKPAAVHVEDSGEEDGDAKSADKEIQMKIQMGAERDE
jgi:vacuolar-type H+-ATPase subunit I/STV1